jgi:hypothetical protein
MARPVRARGRPHPSHERGASSIEFALVVLTLLLPLGLAAIDLGWLGVTRNALRLAAFEAVREGAVQGASEPAMRRALAPALSGLHAGDSDGAAIVRALETVHRPDLVEVTRLRPDRAAFADFGVVRNGRRVIPNLALATDTRVGPASRQRLEDANVLSVHFRYCAPVLFSLTASIVRPVLAAASPDAFSSGCLARGRIPVSVLGTTVMQTPAVE